MITFLSFIKDKMKDLKAEPEVDMEHQLRIVIADTDENDLKTLSEKLKSLGHEVVASCTSGKDLIAACLLHHPSLIVADLDGTCPRGDLMAAVHKICDKVATPVIIISADTDKDRSEVTAGARSVVAHLVQPVSPGSLAACISLGMSSFERYAAACKEVTELKWQIQERKLIDRAKGILMTRAHFTEGEAHAHLQELASAKNTKMSAVAEIIISAEVEFVKSITAK